MNRSETEGPETEMLKIGSFDEIMSHVVLNFPPHIKYFFKFKDKDISWVVKSNNDLQANKKNRFNLIDPRQRMPIRTDNSENQIKYQHIK